jgi:hypothetical protein
MINFSIGHFVKNPWRGDIYMRSYCRGRRLLGLGILVQVTDVFADGRESSRRRRDFHLGALSFSQPHVGYCGVGSLRTRTRQVIVSMCYRNSLAQAFS